MMTAHDSHWLRLLRFPVVRIVLAIAFVVLPVVAVQTGLRVSHLERTRAVLAVALCLGALLSFLGYHVYVRVVERRAVAELATDRALPQLIAGVLVGTLLFMSTIGVLAALGHYRVTGVGMWLNVIVPLADAVQAGVVEEILFRGVIFRIAEESLGSWLALVLSAALFGAIHLLNQNATLLSGVAIMLEAGVLLAAAYMLTRRLWFPIGMHVAWNFVQGGVFGVAVSGTTPRGLLQGVLDGPVWLSGGAFGAEASIVAIALCLSVAVVLLVLASSRQHTAASSWRRLGIPAAAPPATSKERVTRSG